MNMPSSIPPSVLGRDFRPGAQANTRGLIELARDSAPDVLEHLRIVMARKWTVLGIALAAALAASFIVMQMTPIYRATVTILIEQGKSKVVSIEEVYAGASGSREHLTTQVAILENRNVAERVIRRMRLTEHPEFDPRQAKQSLVAVAMQWLRTRVSGSAAITEPLSDEAVTNSIVDGFHSRLLIEPVRLSQLVKVSFHAADRKLAADAANAVADAYIEADMDARYAMTQQAHAWLSERLASLKQNLTASERALQKFREGKGMLDRQTAAMGGVGKQLEELSLRLVEARVRRSQAEQAYNQIRASAGQSMGSVPAVLANPMVSRAREARIETQRRLADASQRLGSAHPLYQAALAEWKAAEAAENQAVESVVQGVSKEFQTARAVERQLEQALASSRGEVQTLNRDEFELAGYEREVAANRQLYETFHARFKETDVAFDFQSAVARVVDRAVAPPVPAKPAKKQIVLGALVCGLLLGIALALLLHRIDGGLHGIEDAEEKLGVPVIAALPILKRGEVGAAHKIVLRLPDHGFSEGIRSTRSAVLLSTAGVHSKVIAVTSSLAGEGKSTIAINLALAMAQTGKTLLIESDMRRPTLARRLGLPQGQKGLAELIAGATRLEDCLVKLPEDGLNLLTAGEQVKNPLELLSSRRFRDLLEQLRNNYETVIVDTPPASVVSDAAMVAALSSAVVFVVKANATPRQLVRQSLRKLGASSTPVLGTVINQLDFKRAGKYYGGYASYSADGYGGYTRSGKAG